MAGEIEPGGVTDAEYRRCQDAAQKDRPGSAVHLFAEFARIKADAYQQGRDDLAAKVQRETEWRNVREYGEEQTPFSNGARQMAMRVRAILAADATPREDQP